MNYSTIEAVLNKRCQFYFAPMALAVLSSKGQQSAVFRIGESQSSGQKEVVIDFCTDATRPSRKLRACQKYTNPNPQPNPSLEPVTRT